jgi:uncharacterized protein (DUF433 family)
MGVSAWLVMSEQIMSDSQQIHVTETYIVKTPGVCGGAPHIAGRRIRVYHVYVWYDIQGRTPDEIASEYDLTLAQVHAALAYAYDHLDEIYAEMREEEQLIAEARVRYPSKLSSGTGNG